MWPMQCRYEYAGSAGLTVPWLRFQHTGRPGTQHVTPSVAQRTFLPVLMAQEAAFASVLIITKFDTVLNHESHYQDLE